MKPIHLHEVVVAALIFAAWAGGGCASPASKPKVLGAEPPPLSEHNRYLASGALEAVEIHEQSSATLMETVESVVTAAGLACVRRDAQTLTFERPATQSEKAAYGNWTGGEVRFRLRVECTSQGRDRFLVRSWCFVVRDAGSYAEDEQALARRKAQNYQQLLAEVWRRLNETKLGISDSVLPCGHQRNGRPGLDGRHAVFGINFGRSAS